MIFLASTSDKVVATELAASSETAIAGVNDYCVAIMKLRSIEMVLLICGRVYGPHTQRPCFVVGMSLQSALGSLSVPLHGIPESSWGLSSGVGTFYY